MEKETKAAEGMASVELDPLDSRPLCPECGEPLYLQVTRTCFSVIPTWDGDCWQYDADDTDHQEEVIDALYCDCGWRAEDWQVEVLASEDDEEESDDEGDDLESADWESEGDL
jgi:hypothetical protein